jgi:hypothetical protein
MFRRLRCGQHTSRPFGKGVGGIPRGRSPGVAEADYVDRRSGVVIGIGWQEFMRSERGGLDERREGKLRQALGEPLAGETKEQLDRIGEEDCTRALQGLVAVVGAHGGAFHKHIDALGRTDVEDRLAARWLEEGWLKQRAECRRKGVGPPPVPEHLGRTSRTAPRAKVVEKPSYGVGLMSGRMSTIAPSSGSS